VLRAGGAAALANLSSTLAAVILQNILPAPYSAQTLVNQEGGVNSLLGLYLNRTLAVVAKASGTNSSQVGTGRLSWSSPRPRTQKPQIQACRSVYVNACRGCGALP